VTTSAVDVVVRPMTPEDIDAVVSLQIAFLEGSIVTGLGPGFLARMHAVSLAHSATIALVACEADQTIVGFAIASLDVHGFNAYVKPRVLTALVRAVAAPRRWRIGLSVLRGVVEAEPQPPIAEELLLLAVDARARRRGIGQRLLADLEAMFARAGVRRYRVAVRSHLAVARAFYLALGFQVEQEQLVLGQPMTYLTKRVAT
jgi:ribosomal protein S18 acetylase RimI-like enzyme